jgi:alpha-glucosidase/alpha-D-xyloside xylohydrolase
MELPRRPDFRLTPGSCSAVDPKRLEEDLEVAMTRKSGGAAAASLVLAACVLNPAAALGADVRYGGGRAELSLSAVSERTVQIVLAPLDEKGKARPAPPSTVLVEQRPQLKLRCRELTEAKDISVGKWRVRVKPGPLTVTIQGPAGRVVQELTFAEADGSVRFRTAAPVLGLGEGAEQFDRRGKHYRMVNGQVAPLLATHGATIPVPFLLGTDGWALFVHRPWGEVDLREGRGRFVPRKEALGKGPLELFVVAVEKPADALAEYVRLTGRAVMPPKWALGYLQSHRTLAGPREPAQIAQTFRDKKLPCDALIYLGTGYCPAGWNVGHGSLEFNPKTFDRPAENLRALHELHYRVILHVNRAPRDLFGASVSEESDSPRHIRNYWARHRKLFALGVDGWWPDDGDELPIEARLARHRCYYEGSLQDRPNVRPWSLHRNGFAGAQRYGGWVWSGDVQSRWATLAAHVPVGVNCSLSLTPFWGTDVGGFVPTKELTGELYVRWFQFGAFNPLFRAHGRTWKLRLPWGWNTGEFGPVEARDGPDRSELRNAEVEPICRKYLELRYRLLPYNYTLIREACDTGLPPMRALWLHYPGDPEAVKLGDEYLWGRDLLVAPVVAKGAKSRRLYLPEGTWYDWWGGKPVAGKRWVERPVDLATLPLYVRAGAILPLDPVRQYTAQSVPGPTTLRVFPGANGAFTLYDDDGQGLGYRDGSDRKTVWLRVRWDDKARRLTLGPDERGKKWPGGARAFSIEVVGGGAKPKRVEYRGESLEVGL